MKLFFALSSAIILSSLFLISCSKNTSEPPASKSYSELIIGKWNVDSERIIWKYIPNNYSDTNLNKFDNHLTEFNFKSDNTFDRYSLGSIDVTDKYEIRSDTITLYGAFDHKILLLDQKNLILKLHLLTNNDTQEETLFTYFTRD